MTAEDGLSQRVREFVARQLDLSPGKLQLTTDVVASARIDGDDVSEFVEEFGRLQMSQAASRQIVRRNAS